MFKEIVELTGEIKLLRISVENLKESIDRMSNINAKETNNSSEVFKTKDGLYNYSQRKPVQKE